MDRFCLEEIMGPLSNEQNVPGGNTIGVLEIEPSNLSGSVKLPPSKSHAMRWLTLASMDHNPTKIVMWEIGEDVQAMVDCLRMPGENFRCAMTLAGREAKPADVLSRWTFCSVKPNEARTQWPWMH